jgi:cytochrome subunit of sulfide dehydrogenase
MLVVTSGCTMSAAARADHNSRAAAAARQSGQSEVVVAGAKPPVGAVSCSGCHPASARVVSPVLRLNGMDRASIVKAMQDFRTGQRTGTVMDRIAKGFTDDEIQAIAAWYATQR